MSAQSSAETVPSTAPRAASLHVEENLVRPIPTNVVKTRIHSLAERAAAALNLRAGDALEPVVARLGGRIVYHSPSQLQNDAKAPESIVVRSSRDFTLYLPTTTSLVRDRFTIAHELGHFFLHWPMVQRKCPGSVMVATRWVDASDTAQQRAEWEANWFAAAFLMPEVTFRSSWVASAPGDRVTSIAAAFGVSDQAAQIRAQTLGLVGV